MTRSTLQFFYNMQYLYRLYDLIYNEHFHLSQTYTRHVCPYIPNLSGMFPFWNHVSLRSVAWSRWRCIHRRSCHMPTLPASWTSGDLAWGETAEVDMICRLWRLYYFETCWMYLIFITKFILYIYIIWYCIYSFCSMSIELCFGGEM